MRESLTAFLTSSSLTPPTLLRRDFAGEPHATALPSLGSGSDEDPADFTILECEHYTIIERSRDEGFAGLAALFIPLFAIGLINSRFRASDFDAAGRGQRTACSGPD